MIQLCNPFFFQICSHIDTHRPVSSVPPWTPDPLQDHLRKEKILPQQSYMILPRNLTCLYVEMAHTENPQPLLDPHQTDRQTDRQLILSWTLLRQIDEQLIQVIWGLGGGQGGSKQGSGRNEGVREGSRKGFGSGSGVREGLGLGRGFGRGLEVQKPSRG